MNDCLFARENKEVVFACPQLVKMSRGDVSMLVGEVSGQLLLSSGDICFDVAKLKPEDSRLCKRPRDPASYSTCVIIHVPPSDIIIHFFSPSPTMDLSVQQKSVSHFFNSNPGLVGSFSTSSLLAS